MTQQPPFILYYKKVPLVLRNWVRTNSRQGLTLSGSKASESWHIHCLSPLYRYEHFCISSFHLFGYSRLFLSDSCLALTVLGGLLSYQFRKTKGTWTQRWDSSPRASSHASRYSWIADILNLKPLSHADVIIHSVLVRWNRVFWGGASLPHCRI